MIADYVSRVPLELHFQDDGMFPNSVLPVLFYKRESAYLPNHLAMTFEKRFEEHAWSNTWRDQIYSYHHYHSTTHEVLAVFQGTAILELGGPTNGSTVAVAVGDVIVIPAGVAHRQVRASKNFAVVGAYPDGREWDLLHGDIGERPFADESIAELSMPACDPLFGALGPLTQIWAKTRFENYSFSSN